MDQLSRNSWRRVLLPLSWLYGAAVWIRNSLYDAGVLKSTNFNIPSISVGNITVGGTGKTPHVEFLVDMLREEYNLGVLSRGYLRNTRDFRIATEKCGPREIGDEPCQIKKRFPDVTVAVDQKRVHAMRELMKMTPPLELVILDDAFQHRSLTPGFSILLIDYNRPMVNDRLLPAGRLREPAANRRRAHMILVTKAPEDIKPIRMREYVNRLGLELGQHLFFTSMRPAGLVPVFGGDLPPDAEALGEQVAGVLVVSGVVNPSSLYDYASGFHENVEEIRFGDHHRYGIKDAKRIREKAEAMGGGEKPVLLLTTEKDAVKLGDLDFPAALQHYMYAVRLEVHFLNGDRENFENQIRRYVRGNQRNNILYQEKGEGRS